MKKIFSKVLIAFAAGSISLTSCTDLDETLYDRLNETNIDLSNEKDLSLLLSAVTAQYRYLVEDWFGMYHLLEESLRPVYGACSSWCGMGRCLHQFA